jgi:uncharacterized membrane protein
MESRAILPPKRRFLLVRLGEVVRDSFWLIPTLFLVGAILVGFLLRLLDDQLAVDASDTPWWVGSPAAASDILATIATAILTFLGVVFSITLVALQLASQQFSPRVTRTFVRAASTKVALGTFIATFVVSLVALTGIETGDSESPTAPVASVTVAQVLVGLSLVVFIVFVNSTTRLVRINFIISSVASETRHAIDVNHPPADAYVPVDVPEPGAPDVVIGSNLPARLARRAYRGVLLGIDSKALVDIASRHGCVFSVTRRIGEYVPRGAPLIEVHGGTSPSEDLMRAVDLGRERTLFQDPLYGIRQLVDIGTQALSAAINAPTSAVQVIDRLSDLLPQIAERPDPSGLFADESGTVRLMIPVIGWSHIVELAFTELRTFGAGSPQVTRRLLACFERLLADLPSERHPPLERQRLLLMAAVARLVADADERAGRLEPDALGLG